VYKSKTVENQYIVEGQRVEGDGFLFGTLYQGVKSLFSSSATKGFPSQPALTASDIEEKVEVAEDEEDLEKFARNVKEMLKSNDGQVALNGIQYAGEMCTDQAMVKFVYKCDIVKDLFDVIHESNEEARNEGYLHEKKWHCQHALIALSHLASKDPHSFKVYASEKNLLARLQHDLGKIQSVESRGFGGLSSAKMHMIKHSTSITKSILA